MKDLADKWMMTHNGGWEGLVLGLELGLGRGQEWRKDCIEGKEGLEGWGEGKK